MATPGRLVELACPSCGSAHWEIDCDYRGAALAGKRELEYHERAYSCPSCKDRGPGWRVLQASPPEFLLQPHPMYPMARAAFDHWATVLVSHFPDHPLVPAIGTTFVPNDHVLRTRITNLWAGRRRSLGRVRRRIRQWLGTGS
jgi:hypothetical protein